MQKHEIFQNQQSKVPTVTVSQKFNELPPSFVVLLSDVASAPEYLKAALTNTTLQEDLKTTSVVLYGREQDSFQKVLVLFSAEAKVEGAYKNGKTHYKKIMEVFKGQSSVGIHFADTFTQAFLNEYVYGLLNENYQWQRKSSPVGAEENKAVFKPFLDFHLVSSVLNTSDEEFTYFTRVIKYVLYGRELMNTRANIANTDWMRDQALAFQKSNSSNVDIEVISGDDLVTKGLRLFHAVGRASSSTPHLVVLNYKGNPQSPDSKIAMVGKGVVYDCGGLSLKQQMTEYMHGDKGGACAVFSAFCGAVEMGLKVNLVCSLALVENMISSNAYRNSDIIQTYKGITVEILNTDAEGRNILADALSYTQLNYKPHTVFDVATLTGAVLVSLGLDTAAVFSNNEEMIQQLIKFSKSAHEPLHHLPITEWMRENIVSETGDIRNLGKQPWGGSGTAAAFLEKFIEKDTKWAHLDIAQASMLKGDLLQVRTLIDYLRSQQ